jgi:hypothetical protein
MLIKRIIIGVIGIALGLLFIKFREQIHRVTGDVGFAEKYLGQGGTFTFFLLLGSATVILAILYMTGVLQSILPEMFGPYF